MTTTERKLAERLAKQFYSDDELEKIFHLRSWCADIIERELLAYGKQVREEIH